MIVAIGLYEGFTTLDAMGPSEILTYLPGAEVVLCAEKAGIVNDHNHLMRIRPAAAIRFRCPVEGAKTDHDMACRARLGDDPRICH